MALGCLAAVMASAALLIGERASIALASGGTSRIRGGVNAEPAMRPWVYAGANPQSWWCQMPDCTADFNVDGQGPLPTIRAELADARALGASDVQEGFPWPLIETARGTFDWTRSDAIMLAATQVGIPILPDLTFTPQWAGGGSMLNVPATDISDWTSFVTDFVQRYGSQLTKGVEIWNEPDNGKSLYDGSAGTYVVDILNPAYAAAKAVDPSLPVVEAGSINDSGACCKFLSAVIADGGKFDVATFHNYAENWISEASAYRSVLDAHGLSRVPLWMTEFGVDSQTGSQLAATQQVFGGNEPLQMASWYNLRDTDAWRCCPPIDAEKAHWGLLGPDFSAKPAYTVLQSYLGGTGSPTTPAQWLSATGPSASASASPSAGAPARPPVAVPASLSGPPGWLVPAVIAVIALALLAATALMVGTGRRRATKSGSEPRDSPPPGPLSTPGGGHQVEPRDDARDLSLGVPAAAAGGHAETTTAHGATRLE